MSQNYLKNKTKISKKEATKLLMEYAVRFHNGVGLGINTGITQKDRELIEESVKTIWPYLYGHKINQHEWFNLNL
jgi:hypothetical protein